PALRLPEGPAALGRLGGWRRRACAPPLQHGQRRAVPGRRSVELAGATRTAARRAIHGDLRLRDRWRAAIGGAALDAQRQLRRIRSEPGRGRAPQLRDPAMSARQRAHAIVAELATTIQEWRRSWCALSPTERATTVVLAMMLAGGVVLRLRNIGFPPRFTFDEHHFVPNARRYLVGEADDNDHPPLGKLLIAV